MSRIDIGEIQDFAFQLRAANQTGRKIIQGIKTTVTKYIEDGSLKGKAVESSKNYYQMTYIPLCDTIIEAMNESEERLKRYIQDFHDQVDPSPNAKIDADGLYELGQMIDRIESKKEALYQRMNSSTEGQMQTYRSQLATAYKQENILEKYLAFEQSHGAFFDHLTDLVQGIQQTVRELQSNIQFNSQTGSYDLSKLNFAAVSRMRKTLGKASATDTIIYDFAAYSKVKQGGMWILSKDGKVDIKATEAYNTASFNGELPKDSNQATEEGELLKATLESLKQNKDPITGQEISKAQSFGILTSLVFGYTTKKYRGKKLSISKSELEEIKNASESALPKSSIGIAQSRINIANGPTRFSSSGNAGFNHIVDRHFNPNRNAGQFTISQDKLKNILSSKETVKIEVKEIPGNQFERIINIGETAGTIKPSIPDNGGKPTNYIRILTDKAGNLITAY
ncbi:TPA: T7SS effector LXG polymorphic toxin, partial [Listeria monocytogenes]